MSKVLLLDIDGCLNLEYPSIILNKNQELLKREPYGDKIWDLFEASTKNMRARPQFLPFYYKEYFKKKFEFVYIITARPEKWRHQTEKWLKKWGFEYDWLYMRPDHLMEMESYKLKDLLLKKHIFPKHKAANISACDDDLSICTMYETHNINAYQTPIDWPILIRDLNVKPPTLTEDMQNLLEYYLVKESRKGKTLKSLSEEFGYHYRSLRTLKDNLTKAGAFSQAVKTKYKRIDIEEFKHLNTETSAYFAGFAASDGTIDVTSNGSVLKWNQSHKDEPVLRALKKKLGAEQEIKRKGSTSEFSIAQPSLVNLLVYRWGITPDKPTKIKFPKKIPAKTVQHFLRGVYDGDSFFYINEHSKKGPQFILCSASKDFIAEISNLYKKLKIKHSTSTKRDEKNKTTLYMLLVPNSEADSLYRFLYKDASIFLDRKRKAIESFLKIK
jgi:hypothetical protein